MFACCSFCACRIAEHQAEKNAPVDVSTAANLAMQLSYNNKNMLQAGLIIAGDAHGLRQQQQQQQRCTFLHTLSSASAAAATGDYIRACRVCAVGNLVTWPGTASAVLHTAQTWVLHTLQCAAADAVA
jgi:hypothetical protein